jgi:multicomponent Na+:H+ antiporter subunit B
VTSIILQTTTRLIFTLLLLFAIFLLLRGHHEPGGGFIAGLVASGAFVLYAVAYDVTRARNALRIDPRMLIGGGLLTASLSGVVSMFFDQPFLTGRWVTWTLFGADAARAGTPLLFDLGVCLTVIGVTLAIIFALAEE